MNPLKRRKKSGLSGIELNITVDAIKDLIAKWQAEQDEQVDEQERAEVDQLEIILNMLKTKLDGPQVCENRIGRKLYT